MAQRILLVALALLLLVIGGVAGYFLPHPAASPVQSGSPVDPSSSPTGIPSTEEDEDFGTVQIYDVLDDGSLDPAASGLTQQVWDTFVRVATPEFASEVMIQYRVGDAPDSDTLAYVYQDESPEFWILADNLATSEDEADLIATLVHEYAHILTLDETEMDLEETSCDTIDLSEGCAYDDSYLWSFEQEFWSDYSDAPDPDNDDEDAAYDFYLEHEDDFVTDYAATNVVEDIAESFMTYVIEDDAEGDSVVAEKLDFFAQYPELAEIRTRIRTEFADELGLAG